MRGRGRCARAFSRAGGAGGRAAEKTADVDLVVGQSGEADVAVLDDMHFEIGLERQVAGVNFEAEPMPAVDGRLRAATIGADGAFAELICAPKSRVPAKSNFRKPAAILSSKGDNHQ